MKSARKKTAEICEYCGEGLRRQSVRVYHYRRRRRAELVILSA